MRLIDGVEVGYHTVANVVHDHVMHRRQEIAVVVVAEVPGVLREAPGLRVLGRQGAVGRLLEDIIDDRRRVADREALRRLEHRQRAVRRLLGPVVLPTKSGGQHGLVIDAVLGSEEPDLFAAADDREVPACRTDGVPRAQGGKSISLQEGTSPTQEGLHELGFRGIALYARAGTHGCACFELVGSNN